MSLAFFPMYPGDFEADTAHLTLAEDGAYNRLLRLCWRTPGCSIPADHDWIHRRMRAVSDEDKAVVDTVLAEFFTVTQQRYSNARLTKEWLAANQAHKRRVEAGSKGGKNKSLKTNDVDHSNALAKPKQPEPEPEPDIRKREVSKDTSPDCAFDDYNRAAERVGWPKAQVLSRARRAARAQDCRASALPDVAVPVIPSMAARCVPVLKDSFRP